MSVVCQAGGHRCSSPSPHAQTASASALMPQNSLLRVTSAYSSLLQHVGRPPRLLPGERDQIVDDVCA